MKTSSTHSAKKAGQARFRRRFVAAVTVIVFGVWCSACGLYQHRVGTGRRVRRSLSIFEQTWQTNRTVLLGLGDSITDGYGRQQGTVISTCSRIMMMTAIPICGRDLWHVLPNLQQVNVRVLYDLRRAFARSLPKVKVFSSNITGIVVITHRRQ